MSQHEKLSEAQMAHIRSLIQPAAPSDLERSISAANRLDRRAEYVARLGVFLAALAGMAVVGGVVWAVTR